MIPTLCEIIFRGMFALKQISWVLFTINELKDQRRRYRTSERNNTNFARNGRFSCNAIGRTNGNECDRKKRIDRGESKVAAIANADLRCVLDLHCR